MCMMPSFGICKERIFFANGRGIHICTRAMTRLSSFCLYESDHACCRFDFKRYAQTVEFSCTNAQKSEFLNSVPDVHAGGDGSSMVSGILFTS
jgi:hypothetical protein